MLESLPIGARAVSRILLLDPAGRVFLIRAYDPVVLQSWWLTPGGGVEPGESFADAAARELREETGQNTAIGPWVWTRHHVYEFKGRTCNQYERFFVARTNDCAISPELEDDYVVGKRWWTLDEIVNSSETFAPSRLAALLVSIVEGKYPATAIDCGI